jgi:predicted ATPase/class 3 adenylate cyclase
MPPDQEVRFDYLKELLSGVDPEQLRQMTPPTGGVITMMFTDIVDSTRVKHEVGDPTYFAALNRHNTVVRECMARHAGHELKTIGDSFFIAFADPGKAVQCAAQIQQTLAETPISVGDGVINVRIGLHTGTPIVYQDAVPGRTDLSGTDVDKAARVESIARGGQVLISEQTNVLTDRIAVHDWGFWELKGLGPQRIFEVLYPGKHPETPVGRMRREPLRFATSFVGREREVAALIELLKRHRLVTAIGMGGIGKTRLADFAARRVSDTFADGAFFVELAGAANSESAVVSKLVEALAVNPAGFKDETEALLRTLQNRRMLIVLDNFEGVISAGSVLVKLLLGWPHTHFLLTSQTPLRIDGEQLYQVPAMGIPAGAANANSLAGLDAFALFRKRARARVYDWDACSISEIESIAEILRLVEGIPLAIELAAAWVGSKTLQEIRNGLDNRLHLLKHRGFGATSRHQSMQACLDYSFGLLSAETREIFSKLAVFAGGFFIEDVEAIGGMSDADELLVSLHERSMLVRQEVFGRSRYSMLATVQEYAAEKLPEDAAKELKRAHAQHFLRVLHIAVQQLHGRSYAATLQRIAINIVNFEAGIRQSQDGRDHRAVVDYVGFLSNYLRIKGRYNDNLTLALMARTAAENLGAEVMADAEINLGLAYSNLPTGDRGDNLRRAIDCYKAALRVRTERDFPWWWAGVQNNLGIAYADLPTGDHTENLRQAIGFFEAALRVWTERDFPQDWALVQGNLGRAYADLPTGDRTENLRRAINCYKAALRVWTERDFPRWWAAARDNLGTAHAKLPTCDRAARDENLRRAINCYKAALRVRTERDFPQDWAQTQNDLGNAYANLPTSDRATRAKNLRRAIDCYKAALRVRTERDFPQDWAATQDNLGNAYASLPAGDRAKNLRRAIDCYKAALRVRTERDFPQGWAMVQENLGNAYASLPAPAGDRAEYMQRVIDCHEAAARGYDAVGLTDEAARVRTLAQELGRGLRAFERGEITAEKLQAEIERLLIEAEKWAAEYPTKARGDPPPGRRRNRARDRLVQRQQSQKRDK